MHIVAVAFKLGHQLKQSLEVVSASPYLLI